MNERNEAERERERGEGGVRRHNHLAGSKSITGETMKLSRRYLPTTSHADRECRPLLSGSRCSSRVPVSRRSLSSRGGSYYPTTSLAVAIFESKKAVASTAFEDEISVRDGISREDRHSFVKTVTKCNAILRIGYSSITLVFFILGHAIRNLRVSLLSNIQRVPSSHSRPMNRERDRFFRHRGRREEKREMDPLGGAQIGSFALPTSHAYASIMNHSRGESEFFFPGTKEICFEGCDRRQFSILTANSSRLLDPRAKIRACLFPNCHRGRGGTERDERRDRHW